MAHCNKKKCGASCRCTKCKGKRKPAMRKAAARPRKRK